MATAERAARNESLFREVNERIAELEETFARPDELVEFICECSVTACLERVPMTVSEYQDVRAEPTRFFVIPHHLDTRYERVVRDHGRFLVVEKLGLAGEIADELAD